MTVEKSEILELLKIRERVSQKGIILISSLNLRIAYVEFYSVDSVNKAISQSGKELDGNKFTRLIMIGCKIKLQPSQAEKNRAAAAAKYFLINNIIL